MKKLVLFDIDKTIYNGYVISPLAECQLDKGIINNSCLNKIQEDFKLYKSGKVDYETTIANLLDHWAEGLKGQNYQDILKETISFFRGAGNKFYGFARPVIKMFKSTHDVYFITGEPKFVGEATALIFSIKGLISSKLEVENLKFTGRVEKYLARRNEKLSAIQCLVKKYKIDGSFAFGDSEADIQMLNLVQNAICINATDGLKKHAQKHNWHVATPGSVTNLVSSLIRS